MKKRSMRKIILFMVAIKITIIFFVIMRYAMNSHVNQVFSSGNMQVSQCGEYDASQKVIRNKIQKLDKDNNSYTILNVFAEGIRRGVYDIKVTYKADVNGNTITADSSSGCVQADTIFLDNTSLKKNDYTTKSFRIWTTDYVGELRFDVNQIVDGNIAIKEIQIKQNSASIRVDILNWIVLFSVFDLGLIYFIYYRYIACRDAKIVLFTIVLTVFVSSIPLFMDRIIVGDDILFHVPRIEGIIEGLKSGQFPVKLQPNWWDGLGYNVSYFYGDTFLYIPAILYLYGYNFQTSYKIFILIVNVATCLIMYYSAKKIFENSRIALVSMILYALAPYRLLDIYHRFAVGEYLAMTFLPGLFYGFWCVLDNDSSNSARKSGSFIIALSLSAIIQSHVLSCVMIMVCLLPLLLVMIKKVKIKSIFLSLVKALCLTIVFNIWYIVPFILTMITQHGFIYSTNQSEGFKKTFQMYGAELYDLTAVFPHGQMDGISVAVGIGFIIVLILYIYQKADKQGDKFKYFGNVLFVMGILTMIASLNIIPYDYFIKRIPALASILGSLQFPWRFLSIASVSISFLACVVLYNWNNGINRFKYKSCIIIIVTLTVVSSMSYLSSMINSEKTESIYDAGSVRTIDGEYAIGRDYVDADIDPAMVSHQISTSSSQLMISNVVKRYENVYFNVKSASDRVENVNVPLIYYDGYVSYGNKGTELSTHKDDNGAVAVEIPEGYSGCIHVMYKEKSGYRVLEFISLVTLIISVYHEVVRKKESLSNQSGRQ